MFLKERVEALILGHEDHGETDRKLILLTDQLGKIQAVARGARKPLSKLRSGLNLYNWSEVELVSGRSYPIITAAKEQFCFVNFSRDWKKFLIAQKMMKEVEALMPWRMVDHKTWLLSLGALHALNQINNHYQRLYYYFLWTLLATLGYQVDLNHCARCGSIFTTAGYVMAEDGIVCPGCLKQEDFSEEISLNTIKILRLIAEKDKNLLGRIKTDKSDQENLANITEFFLKSVQGRQRLNESALFS
jgi:DNA repair protein RecO (recombination protein O)